eukprot:scaffold32939_cov96-Isochrysis_galbana.AAC.2
MVAHALSPVLFASASRPLRPGPGPSCPGWSRRSPGRLRGGRPGRRNAQPGPPTACSGGCGQGPTDSERSRIRGQGREEWRRHPL